MNYQPPGQHLRDLNYLLIPFIDIRKAFDKTNHDILFNKLERYGIRGIELVWVKSYLSKRQQFVKLGNKFFNMFGHLEVGFVC